MSRYLNLVFISSELVGQVDSLETIISRLQAAGYKLSSFRVGDWVPGPYISWEKHNNETAQQLSVAYEKQHLSFIFVDNIDGGPIILTFYIRWQTIHGAPSGGRPWSWHLWKVEGTGCHTIVEARTDDTAMFTQKQWQPEKNAERLLRLAKLMYDILKPRFAWVERCHWKGYTTPEDVMQLRVPHIYWANFFSPAYVEKVGHAFLSNAPGKIEGLADGGLLYVISPSLEGTGPKAVTTAVKEYFGVPHVRLVPKERKKRR